MKIVGSDYDGTFTYGGVTEEKMAAVQKWQSAGNLFGIISGRDPKFRDTLRQTFPGLILDFFAACNGGHIIDSEGNIIYEARCTGVPMEAFIRDLLAWGCPYIYFCGEQTMFLTEKMENLPSDVSEEQACLIGNLPPIDYFNQISVPSRSLEMAAENTKRINEKYKQFVTALQNGLSIDIVPAGVNKANGLYRVMEHFGCQYEDMIAVGDNFNDADMLREFRSYAMAHAVDEIRNMANGIVGSVTELLEREL